MPRRLAGNEGMEKNMETSMMGYIDLGFREGMEKKMETSMMDDIGLGFRVGMERTLETTIMEHIYIYIGCYKAPFLHS